MLSSQLFWSSFWIALNVSVTILNKACFSIAKFPPVSLTCIHLLFTWFLSIITYTFSRKKSPKLGIKHIKLLLFFSILFALNIAVGNSSLKAISVSLTQTIRATTPLFVVGLSIFLLKSCFNELTLISLPILFFGLIITFFGEIQFKLVPSVFAVFGVFLSALKTVLSNKFLVGEFKLDPFLLLSILCPFALIVLGPYSLIKEQSKLIDFLDNAGVLAWFLVLSSGFFAFFLNFSNFMLNKSAGPLTVTICGIVKQILTIILSVLIFQNIVTPLNCTGMFVVIGGVCLYSYAQIPK
ncbi:hypothetical protein RCL1_002204 [Eukaryota sp. TZLM3-RCL]